MKIAVLISGEYRTFGLCRSTMKFLDDPRVDIYFSTWDKTIYNVPKINFHKEEIVTEEHIRKDLGKDVVIDIEPHNLFQEVRYNSKMIHRWKRGFELIKNSNIDYDFVLVMRPDLYFSEFADHSFSFIEQYRDRLAAGWLDPNLPGFLNDVMLLSSYERMIQLFDSLTIDEWIHSENADWHTWWHSFTIKHFPIIEDLSELARCTFCRPWVNELHTFGQVSKIQEDWSDLIVLQLIDGVGRDIISARWPKDTLSRADNKWNSGLYNQYRSPKVAIIISGMLRNYETAMLSLDIWGPCDRFLVTWNSSGEDSINEYCKRANIKQKYIISDDEFEKVYRDPYKNGNNTFRMVYLWEQVFHNVPKDYDKYIIIRPDGFYWTNNVDKVRECIKTEGPFKTSQTRTNHTTGIDDHVLFIDKTHFNKLQNCYSELIQAAHSMIEEGIATNVYGDYLNPHELLFRLWNQNILKSDIGSEIDLCSSKMHSCIEPLWVRKTFTKLGTDKYDRNLYKAVFYDTASSWRKIAGCDYHGTFDRLEKYD